MLGELQKRIGLMPKRLKQALLALFDAAALSACMWAAYALRLGTTTLPGTPEQFIVIALAPLVAIPIFVRMGLYRAVVRYMTERAIWTILQAVTLASLCWVVLVFLTEMAGRVVVPRSVPFIYWTLALLLIAGSRFFARQFLGSSRAVKKTDRPVIVYGAGDAGVQLVQSLRHVQPVIGFLDDDPTLQGRDVAGLRVHPPESLPRLVANHGIREVIFSMPALTAQRRQEIIATVSGRGVKMRTLPNIADVASGKYLISQLREIDIDELLGRSSVPADPALIAQIVNGRTILVTGAGGSIGSELCRMLCRWKPQRLVLLEANEFALYEIERELGAENDLSVVPVLGSVTDAGLVSHVLSAHDVEVVFHAAAHKHVPLVETNALEGIRNNVIGTRVLVENAYRAGVERFVLISTDKAVRPTNVMGATKRWAELIVQEAAARAGAEGTGQRFSAVRFGNVLGSNGSTVPLFKEQIAKGGPVTLTDPGMMRYFMSIHEAAELIVQAGALSEGGDVFLLDMGEPILIKELAENMIRLAGFTVRDEANPEGDIEIVSIGKRPGEKLFEELFYDADRASPTAHRKILRGEVRRIRPADLQPALARLAAAVERREEAEARRLLFDFIRDEDRASSSGAEPVELPRAASERRRKAAK